MTLQAETTQTCSAPPFLRYKIQLKDLVFSVVLKSPYIKDKDKSIEHYNRGDIVLEIKFQDFFDDRFLEDRLN